MWILCELHSKNPMYFILGFGAEGKVTTRSTCASSTGDSGYRTGVVMATYLQIQEVKTPHPIPNLDSQTLEIHKDGVAGSCLYICHK